MLDKLFVIDTYAHFYQMYYAIRGLTGPGGEPVNAVYGFARLLRKVRHDYNPDYLAAAADAPGKVFRHHMYEEYKATRKPMPEDLQAQLPLLQELLEAESIPVLMVEGYEADDVMGTVARLAAGKGVQTVLVTTDKDAEQLIDPMTSVLHMRKDSEKLLDAGKLEREKGLRPEQVIDLMALAGDASDNIPGIPGIGPKTALKLIQRFGSIDNLYANLDEVERENLREKLRQNRGAAELSRRLVTIKCDAPVELDLERCRTDAKDAKALILFYQSLGFRSLVEQVGSSLPGQAVAGQASLFATEEKGAPCDSIETLEKNYSVAADAESVRQLTAALRASGRFAVDLETTSLSRRDARIVGFAFSTAAHAGTYVPTAGPPGDDVYSLTEALAGFRGVLEDSSLRKVGQNLKYDIAVLKNYGVELRGVAFDTMVASYLLQPSERGHGLDKLALRHLRYRMVPIRDLIGAGRQQTTMDRVPVAKVAPYACEDADVALQLSEKLAESLKEQRLWDLFTDLELPLVPVLANLEWHGIKVDESRLAAISREFEQQLAELERKIFTEAGEEFNLNSPRQLSEVLFNKLRLPPPSGHKRTTGYATDRSVLASLRREHPIAELLLKYRELSKLQSTYAYALRDLINKETGRIHASFNQTMTATGRLSSSEPNLQNIPVRTPLGRRIRSAFVPSETDMSLLAADYSQVELRILAHCCGDESLTEAFRHDRDIHTFVAGQIYGVSENEVTPEMRNRAKGVNFGIVYGQGARGLSNQIDVPIKEAREFIDSYFRRYPKVKEFINDTVDDARRKGYVQTLAGRRRRLPGINDTGSVRRAAERMAVNTVIQGSAADLIKKAMILIDRGLPEVSPRAHMLLQIHDELVFEVPDTALEEAGAFITENMTAAMDLSVPLKVDIAVGKDWEQAK